MGYIAKLFAVSVLGSGLALAQAASSPAQSSVPGAQQSTQSQAGGSSAAQQPGMTSQSQSGIPGQSATLPNSTSSAALAQAESNVQDALNKELPTSNITVSSSSGNEIQLNGTVTSQSEKQRAEDIARSATHGQSIVNRITVSGSSPDQSNPNQSNPK